MRSTTLFTLLAVALSVQARPAMLRVRQDIAAAAAAAGKDNGAAAGKDNGAAAGKDNGAAAAGKGNGAAAGAGGDLATSTTLDPSVIAKGFADDGQNPPVEGQSPSLTSTNNFINFCAGDTITDGKQVKEGSCNPCPIGKIPSTQNMPSSKFAFPTNGDASLQPNQAFTVKLNIQNIQTGTFVNAQKKYFAAPQQLNAQGQIIGHTHVAIEQVPDLASTAPMDINKFAFFKGINEPAQNGQVTAQVADGLPAGAYRLCSMNAAANHQPAIVPIAQHGNIDDCVYFTVGGAGAGKDNGAAAAAGKDNGAAAGKDNGAAAAGKDNGAAAAGKDNGAAAADAAAGKDNGAAAAGKDNGAAAGKDNGAAAAGKDNGAAAGGKDNGAAAAGKDNGAAAAAADAAAGKDNGAAAAGKENGAAAAGKDNGAAAAGKANGQA